MKAAFLVPLLVCLFKLTDSFGQTQGDFIVTSDIDNFWVAYDKVKTTNDTFLQLQYLDQYFFSKGSAGLPLIMQARRYTPKEYLSAINQFPLFWTSIRSNTQKAKDYGLEIEQGIEKLRVVYPELKQTNLYFTIGALKTNGTSMNKKLLIGCELAMADSTTNTSEFTTSFTHLKPYFATNPIKDIVFLNIHEYVHTQQNTEGGYDLLSQSLFEGIAEFIPVIALKQASPVPAISFGKSNDQMVKAAFEREMFSPWIYHWIWNDHKNAFQTRDLGYYIGYAIAEKYYQKAKDKRKAIRDLIELDFNDPKKIEAFIQKTGYFSKKIKKLKRNFESSRPFVTEILEFQNGSKRINPNTKFITVVFSQELDKRFRSTDFGKLGKAFFPEIVSAKFAEDGRSITYEVRLKPNQKYQFVVEQSFRSIRAIPLKSYVVEFSTSN
jgi:hypothetical protein